MMFKFLGFTFLLVQVFSSNSYAQDVLKSGLLGEIKTKLILPNNWELESKFQNRQIFLESILDQELTTTYEYERTDIGHSFLKKLGNKKVGLGYLIRWADTQVIHRFSQIYTIKKKHKFGQFQHRLLFDQTFTPELPALFRFRYRIGLVRFLNTTSDKGNQFYAKLNQESLLKVNFLNSSDVEFRVHPSFGVSLQKSHTIELGLEYRISDFGKNKVLNGQYWLYLGFNIILN